MFYGFANEFFRVTPLRVSDPIGQHVTLSSRAEGPSGGLETFESMGLERSDDLTRDFREL